MKFIMAIAVITVIALIGTRVTFLNRKLPIGIRNFLLTGVEYIFIGAALGKMGLNFLDVAALQNFEPFLLFGLSLVGFLYGSQFEIKLIRRLPRYFFSITALQSSVIFLIVTFFTYFIFQSVFLLSTLPSLLSAIMLGSTAACTAQSALAIVSKNYKLNNKGLLELLRYISSVDGLFALVFFTLALSIIPIDHLDEFHLPDSINSFFITILLGVIPAFILITLGKIRFSDQEYLVFVIGTILFCGGLAAQIQHSPLVSGLICGMVTANFCRHRTRALQTVLTAEKSVYIILLLLIGASWDFKFDCRLILIGVYFMTRILGKIVGNYIAVKIYRPYFPVPPLYGLGLLSEGGLTVAIALNFQLLYPELADILVTVVIASITLNDFISPKLIIRQFKEANSRELNWKTRDEGRLS